MNLVFIYMFLRKKGYIVFKYNDYIRESLYVFVVFFERGEMNLFKYLWN